MSTDTDSKKDEETWDQAPTVDPSAVSGRGRLHYDTDSKTIKTDTDSRARAEDDQIQRWVRRLWVIARLQGDSGDHEDFPSLLREVREAGQREAQQAIMLDELIVSAERSSESSPTVQLGKAQAHSVAQGAPALGETGASNTLLSHNRMSKLSIPLVTSWTPQTGVPCGISEHSAYLKTAVEAADAEIELVPDATWLDPEQLWLTQMGSVKYVPKIVHINHHDGLHSRWTAEHVQQLRAAGSKVVCTYHDTHEGTEAAPNSMKAREWAAICDAFIVHEPVADIVGPQVKYWRQGVPELKGNWEIDRCTKEESTGGFLMYADQPIVGSVGFAFPWKGFELLCDAAREAGWAVLLIAHNATDEQVADWQQRNPHIEVVREFVEAAQVVRLLHNCTATAFLYSCANTGQSAAILQGIGARRPVIATDGCRQFRALHEAYPHPYIHWCAADRQGVMSALSLVHAHHFTEVVAEQESWARLGVKYAGLYRDLLK